MKLLQNYPLKKLKKLCINGKFKQRDISQQTPKHFELNNISEKLKTILSETHLDEESSDNDHCCNSKLSFFHPVHLLQVLKIFLIFFT